MPLKFSEESRLDKHWANHELLYDYQATLNAGNWKS